MNNPLSAGVKQSGIRIPVTEQQIKLVASLKAEDEHYFDIKDTKFRGKSIEWIREEELKTINNALDPNEPLVEAKGMKNKIDYDGTIYNSVEDFLFAMFPEYKKYNLKAKFLNNNIFYLSTMQRANIQYHILERYIIQQGLELVRVSKQDEQDLSLFFVSSKDERIQKLAYRMEWKNGIERMITFGASKDVRGTNKGTFCYKRELTDTKLICTGVKMDWKRWAKLKMDEIERLYTKYSKDIQAEYCKDSL